MKLKNIMLVLLCELSAYATYYVWGVEGKSALQKLKKEYAVAEQELACEKELLRSYDKLLQDWYDYPFYKEQVLRDELHYMYPDEELFQC